MLAAQVRRGLTTKLLPCLAGMRNYSSQKSSRAQLPVFLPDRTPSDSAADFDAADVHKRICKAAEHFINDCCESRNAAGAPSVDGFYLADRPFRASFFPPDKPKWHALLADFGKAWTMYKIGLINPTIVAEWNKPAMIEAFEQAVTVILTKLSEGKGQELVDHKLMTQEAFDAIESNLSKLDSNQLRLLEMTKYDFTMPEPMMVNVELLKSDDGSSYVSFFLFDTALFASDKLEFKQMDKGTKPKLIVKDDYPFDAPKQIYINLVFERQIAPAVGDYIVSQFNFIVVP